MLWTEGRVKEKPQHWTKESIKHSWTLQLQSLHKPKSKTKNLHLTRSLLLISWGFLRFSSANTTVISRPESSVWSRRYRASAASWGSKNCTNPNPRGCLHCPRYQSQSWSRIKYNRVPQLLIGSTLQFLVLKNIRHRLATNKRSP
jgi:hypothetical protein